MKPSTTEKIVILTGAGVSAESGIPTFRDQDGLWENHKVEDIATPEGFAKNPKLVHQFYNLRRTALEMVMPNAAHLAIAELQQRLPGQVTLITQNVDDLHERAGSPHVIHMHGEIKQALCNKCGHQFSAPKEISLETSCPHCKNSKEVRPDVVWFGEIPYHMEEIMAALATCTQFVAIGTSGQVYPASKFVKTARYKAKAVTIEINNQETVVSDRFHKKFTGPASIKVPEWVNRVLQA